MIVVVAQGSADVRREVVEDMWVVGGNELRVCDDGQWAVGGRWWACEESESGRFRSLLGCRTHPVLRIVTVIVISDVVVKQG